MSKRLIGPDKHLYQRCHRRRSHHRRRYAYLGTKYASSTAFITPPSNTSLYLSTTVAFLLILPQLNHTSVLSHFHSTTHEVLCIVSERAKLCFDGEENPERVETAVEKGDVIIIPAGVAHRSLEDLEGNFLMVGSYPVRKNWDMCYGSADEEGYTENIKHLEWLKRDPIYEDDGPALGA